MPLFIFPPVRYRRDFNGRAIIPANEPFLTKVEPLLEEACTNLRLGLLEFHRGAHQEGLEMFWTGTKQLFYAFPGATILLALLIPRYLIVLCIVISRICKQITGVIASACNKYLPKRKEEMV